MNKIRSLLLLALFLVALKSIKGAHSFMPLNQGWKFRQVSSIEWLPASVPGSVYLDLLSNGKIPDPFQSDNESKVQWVDTCDWEYMCSFDVSPAELRHMQQELELDGLDTYAEVILNGQSVLQAANMFRSWRLDVRGKLKPKANILVIRFNSAYREAKAAELTNGFKIPGGERVFVRKAAFQWGWDFAPRFLGCGIWKPVRLHCWSGFILDDLHIRQISLTDAKATVQVVATVRCDIQQHVQIDFSVVGVDSRKSLKHLLLPGMNTITDTLEIISPRRWWTSELGDPFLYEMEAILFGKGKDQADKKVEFGLRTLELRQERDVAGRTFQFILNGIPVFMKGANVVPPDVFLTRIDSGLINRFISDAIASHMNMFRVWGGGVYPSDEFFKACDRHGILVWEDFMVACSMLPGSETFIDDMREEVRQNIIRLRNHPSIALWCGNNESDEGWHNWGWQKEFGYSSEDSSKVWNDYHSVFHKMIPDALDELDPDREYWPSSPSIGWGRKESLLSGDAHYWGVWWGMEPFSVYTKKVGRFMSEYGFQGLPAMASFKQYSGTDRLDTTMPALKVHQKHPTGFPTISNYLERSYNRPKDFRSYIYTSQLLQAEGVRTAIEAHRRAKPYCMGTLYWQFNDCWPSVSWSSRDFYGRWKALQYFVKESYEPLIISPVVNENRSVDVHVVTDSLHDWLARMELRIIDFKGNIRWSEIVAADIKSNASTLVCSRDLSRIVQGMDTAFTFLNVRLLLNERTVTQKNAFFCLPKSMKLQRPSFTVRSSRIADGSVAVVIRASAFVKGLEISLDGDPSLFSENYFDMIPNTDYVVPVRSADFKETDLARLQYRSLYDTY
ncbi:MAG: glycoside hydrolase family 2 protein [Bacteroidota bacterium]